EWPALRSTERMIGDRCKVEAGSFCADSIVNKFLWTMLLRHQLVAKPEHLHSAICRFFATAKPRRAETLPCLNHFEGRRVRSPVRRSQLTSTIAGVGKRARERLTPVRFFSRLRVR